MKKLISVLLVVIVLFNFILGSGKAYASDGAVKYNSESGEDIESALDVEKQSNIGSGISAQTLGSIVPGIVNIIGWVANLFPEIILKIMSQTTGCKPYYTIEDTVFNRIPLFDINYFDLSKANDTSLKGGERVINIMRLNVAKWYYIIRLIAIAASLLVLIYVGIRMALSTVAADKTKYKEMLIYWFESIVLLFTMQYILSVMFTIANGFTNMFADWGDIFFDKDVNFEASTLNTIKTGLAGNGWKYVIYSIIFWFLVFLQLKFYINYFKRIVTVGFLIIISPLVTITYAIDKIGDGKAQAFSVMITELIVNIAIQPAHALIYLIFMATAGAIAKKSILVALIFMLFITKVEKFILYLFNMRNVVSLKAVNEEKGLQGIKI